MRTLGMPLLVLFLSAPHADARPVESGPDDAFLFVSPTETIRGRSGLSSTAGQDTIWFGGTVWAADSMRWEALQDSIWTFESGVGSHFDHGAPHVDPSKDPSLHASMEGWLGFNANQREPQWFRRISTAAAWDGTPCVGSPAGLGGNWSLWAGALRSEADSLCYAKGQGYGSLWYVCVEQTFFYDGSGDSVAWSYDFVQDTEAGFDYTYALVDTTGLDDQVEIERRTGVISGSRAHGLHPGSTLRSTAGPYRLLFCVRSDGAYDDQDGIYPTTCGALAVDDVAVNGGGVAYATDFESDAGGWTPTTPPPALGGEWSRLDAVTNLGPVLACGALGDSVLLFEDLTDPGHGIFQNNLAASPWIDLGPDGAGLAPIPGKVLEFTGYFNLPLLNYVLLQTQVQWYPFICPLTGKLAAGQFESDGFIRYYGGLPVIFDRSNPAQVDFSHVVPPEATQIRVAVGVISYCRFFANCTGTTNSTPWIDDVRLGVYGATGAPLLHTMTRDLPQDAFPENGTIGFNYPGRIDCNDVKGTTTPEVNTSLGDTLIVRGGQGGAEVRVQFAVHPGYAIDSTEVSTWLSGFVFEGTSRGQDWYSARMDTAQQGGTEISAIWMTAFHEEDPLFSGTDTDVDPTDIDPLGQPSRLLNDIFPDDLFTPGTRINLFYKARYLNGSSWFTEPDTTGGTYHEWECLPSSAEGSNPVSGTNNCVLYVNKSFDPQVAERIETALGALLGFGSDNFEGTNWDRYDIHAPNQASLGRPVGTEYGATAYQLLKAYDIIIFDTGDHESATLTNEDANVLNHFARANPSAPTYYNRSHLYLSGNNLVEWVTTNALAEPQAFSLLQSIAGVELVCGALGSEDCPNPSPADSSLCLPLTPTPTARVAGFRPTSHAGISNGCPDPARFDVLSVAAGSAHAPVLEETWEKNGVPSGTAGSSVSNIVPESGRVLVDGLSPAFRGTLVGCAYDPAATRERLAEVFTWFECGVTSGTTDVPPGTPLSVTALGAFAPNPYLGGTGRVRFSMEAPGPATVTVFDLQGRQVRVLFHGEAGEGENEAVWDGRDEQGRTVGSGVYFYRLRAHHKTQARKLVLLQGR